MSSPTAPATPAPDAPDGSPRRRSSRRLVLVVLGLSLLVAGTAGWRTVAANTLDDVVVHVADHHCNAESAAVRRRPDNLTVETAADMRCTFSIHVDNDSQHHVHLGDVRADIMGPDTGAVIRAESIDGATPRADECADL